MNHGDVWIPPLPTPPEHLIGFGAGAAGRVAAPAARALLRSGLEELFGPPTGMPGPASAPRDPGWFGPHSVVWRVHADMSMVVGAIAALAFQALHPRAMAGVIDHSDFTTDPIGRLRRTAQFVTTTAYGSHAAAERACAVVRRVHRAVEGTTPDGTPYRADDPELLDWVHCTEFGAFAAANRRYAANPVSLTDLDIYVDEVGRIGTELGMPSAPASWAELHHHLERHRPELAVGPHARQAWAFLADPPLPGPARRIWPVLFRGALACLPRWATDAWEVRRPSMAERARCRAATRTMGAVLGPSRSLAAAHERLASAGPDPHHHGHQP